MPRFFITISLIIFIYPLALTQQVYLTRSGAASFTSNAPLEIIKAQTSEMHGAIDLDKRTFAFTIDNKSFQGFNSALQQEHFYENYMEIQSNPISIFEGKLIEEIDLTSTVEQTVRAKGMLGIHGVSQERIIRGSVRVVNDKIQVKADFTVLLEDHQIKVPKVVNQKIAESIEVSISAELVKNRE
jgi:hypothetical protein